MLWTNCDRAICARYSTRDAKGLVRCGECPLRINTCRIANACKANSHWDAKTKQWELDGNSADELFKNGWKKMLKYTDITGREVDKVGIAIQRLKSFEPPEGYWLAFSGGKDSCCIKALADMACVKYDAHYNVTTVDPPELVRFIRKNHPGVIFNRPEMSMRKLIVKKKTPPTRKVRYCCEMLKENSGKGRIVVTGVRWAESVKRAKLHGVVSVVNRAILNDDNDETRRIVEQCYRTQKTLVNPIIDWTDDDVWEFLKTNNIPYCELYDQGFRRLGCVGCPVSVRAAEELERWTQYKKMYLKAFDEMLEARRAAGLKMDTWKDAQSVMDWWLGKKTEEKQITGQIEFEDDV